jgi:hypothetical protein
LGNRFEASRGRVLAAIAAVEAAERECLQATMGQVLALAAEAGLAEGLLVIFHAVPRGDAVWALDEQDCSREDAVLQAVDLADVSGRRLRLTPAGLAALPRDSRLPEPPVAFGQSGRCFLHGGAALAGTLGSSTRQLPPVVPRLGGRCWQRAVLTWVDLHRALATWTGRWLAATLVVAPETGDVASLDPLYCPDRGQDFEVVTSLRLADDVPSTGDVDAALVNVLEEQDGVTADLVELDLRRWLHGAGLALPGFPAHPPGDCESPADER